MDDKFEMSGFLLIVNSNTALHYDLWQNDAEWVICWCQHLVFYKNIKLQEHFGTALIIWKTLPYIFNYGDVKILQSCFSNQKNY